MTVEEKRKAIEKHCQNSHCVSCVLHDRHEELNYCFSSVTDNDVNINYEILFGGKNDPVNRPSHYTDGKIEVIEFIEDKNLGFCLGNAVKYIARAGKKDPTKEIEDLNKAKWYIERRIKELKEASA